MNEREEAIIQNYLDGIEYAKDIGYAQCLDRKYGETRLYNCGGLPVEVTLPVLPKEERISHESMQQMLLYTYVTGDGYFNQKN